VIEKPQRDGTIGVQSINEFCMCIRALSFMKCVLLNVENIFIEKLTSVHDKKNDRKREQTDGDRLRQLNR